MELLNVFVKNRIDREIDALRHLIRREAAVDDQQRPPLSIEFEDRSGRARVHRQALSRDVCVVVGPKHERAAAGASGLGAFHGRVGIYAAHAADAPR